MPSSSVLEAVGNTPVVQLHKVVPAGSARVFIKLEYFHPTGIRTSIRTAAAD
jgi:cysteine synthase